MAPTTNCSPSLPNSKMANGPSPSTTRCTESKQGVGRQSSGHCDRNSLMLETPLAARKSASRNLYAFGLTSFFNDTASEMAYWVLPAFLASLGAGPAKLGVIEGIAESVASLAKLFSGYLADRWTRRKPLVVAGYIVANAVKPLLAVVTWWGQVLAIRFVDRFAKGARGTARDVMVAESVSRERMGSAYGLIQAMDSAGAIAGPLLALWILGRGHGMRAVFWMAAIPGTLCVVVALLGIRETKNAVSSTETPLRAELGD